MRAGGEVAEHEKSTSGERARWKQRAVRGTQNETHAVRHDKSDESNKPSDRNRGARQDRSGKRQHALRGLTSTPKEAAVSSPS